MDLQLALIICGFLLAAYSTVANDSIQTVGTFLSSNAHRPWWLLWIFISGILCIVLLYGWHTNDGDVAYGRLEKYPFPEDFSWIYVLAPLILLGLTKFGYPVSTTFLILTVFAPKNLGAMLIKSLSGYAVAIIVTFLIVFFVTRALEKKFAATNKEKPPVHWVIFQWFSTAFLWSQWLIQDLANIYVFLPRNLEFHYLILSLVLMICLQGVLLYFRGGKIQKVVLSKTNVTDIRSACIIDLLFGIILFIFKNLSNIPMSTTWVFLGVLAGRELALTLLLKHRGMKGIGKNIGSDAFKAIIGLIISVLIALLLPKLAA
ncbi:MAG: hypothetical protein AAGA18_03185 [Verrucomicrobiota bacterium]